MYFYVYKVTNLTTNQYYIGRRQSKVSPEEDFYLGSSVLVKRDVKLYGKSNFKKEILYLATSVKDALAKEGELVTRDVIKDPLSYNLAIGGWGANFTPEEWREIKAKSFQILVSNPERYKAYIKKKTDSLTDFYATSTRGQELKEFYRKGLGEGYSNRMNKRFFDYYEENIESITKLLNLGFGIKKVVTFLGLKVKPPKLQKYLTEVKGLEFHKDMGYEEKETPIAVKLKNPIGHTFNEYRMHLVSNHLSELTDLTYSDSYIDNHLFTFSIGVKKYLKYLGVVEGETIVNIRTVSPDAQRKTAKKTLVSIDKIANQVYYSIEGDIVYEHKASYQRNEHGRIISLSWSRLEIHKRGDLVRCTGEKLEN